MERCERESVLTKSGEGEEDRGCEAAAQCSKLKKKIIRRRGAQPIPNPTYITTVTVTVLHLSY